jgi:hypothetical protein
MNIKFNKNKLTKLVLIVMTLSLVNTSLFAQTKKNSKNVSLIPTVDYKCHVTLRGGIHTIYLFNSVKKSYQELAIGVIGKEIKRPFSSYTLPIKKVYECTSIYSEFTNAKSQQIDARAVR